jgi:hypothetical protein
MEDFDMMDPPLSPEPAQKKKRPFRELVVSSCHAQTAEQRVSYLTDVMVTTTHSISWSLKPLASTEWCKLHSPDAHIYIYM